MLNRLFKFEQRQSNLGREAVGGTTTFLAMAYIIFVNPDILSAAGMDKPALIAVTCVVTALACFLTGILANAPIAMAPGMGLNAFFAYSLVLGNQIRWETALGIVFLSGFFFLLLTLAGVRQKFVEAIPASMVSAMSVGIGLFITFIGLVNLGIVVRNEQTLVAAGALTPTVCIGLVGFLVMIILEIRRIRGAMIAGILTASTLAVFAGAVPAPERIFSFQVDLSRLSFKLNIADALKWSFIGPIFTLMFMDMFDSLGSLVACCQQARLTDENGRVKGLDRLLALDAGATMLGALLGTSTTTTYVESAAGIEQGGRTGMTAVITGFWFLLGLIFIPLIAVVPSYATAPALILVGFFMMKEIRKVSFSTLEEGFPAFVIMIMIALSYSISTGLAFGFISFVTIKVILFKFRDIRPAMWVIFLLSVVYFLL